MPGKGQKCDPLQQQCRR